MTPLQRTLKKLSIQQRAVYETICRVKFIRASGTQLTTCRSLERTGLIKQNSESEYKNEFVLNGEPVILPVKYNQPLEVVGVNPLPIHPNKEDGPSETTQEPKSISLTKGWERPAAVYSNVSREQHVERILNGDPVPADIILPVKSLSQPQMDYIVQNYSAFDAKAMALHLKVDVIHVRTFCQLNGFELPKKRKLDTFHAIPHEKKLRMKRVGYNGPQKKTA
jgi:hypothetical protein